MSLTDRGISTAPYGTVINTLKAVTYTFGLWAYYEVIRARTLLSGGMVNPAGNIVFPTKAYVVSAASDFSSYDGVADLVLGIKHCLCTDTFMINFFPHKTSMTPVGKGANSYPIASYVWAMLYGSTQPQCSIASALNDYVYWSQTSSDAEAIADRYSLIKRRNVTLKHSNCSCIFLVLK